MGLFIPLTTLCDLRLLCQRFSTVNACLSEPNGCEKIERLVLAALVDRRGGRKASTRMLNLYEEHKKITHIKVKSAVNFLRDPSVPQLRSVQCDTCTFAGEMYWGTKAT